MNSLLAPTKEKIAKPVGSQCFCSKQVFQNHQALGGHLRAHQEEISSKRSSSYPSHFRNSVSITSSTESFSMPHPEKFSAAAWSNPSTVLSKAPSPLDFSKRFYSNENRGMNVSKFYEKGTSAMPPKCSPSSGRAEVQNSRPLPLIAPAPPGGIVPTSVPLSPPLEFVSRLINSAVLGMVCQCHPFQDRNCAVTPYLMNVLTDRHPDLSSNQSHGFEEPNPIGSLPPDPTQSALNSGKDKRRKSGKAGGGAEMMNPMKRPKINSEFSMETDKPPKRELLLFTDADNHFAGLGISSNAKEDDQTHVDVSLHL